MATRKFKNPKGTRDFYPADMLRRRYITEAWRAVSLRHGFEEIDGPTFEHLDLYTVKSGEEIVSQLFSFQRQGGDDTYALRPEFTPTLARMYAARAAQLPKPVRWFSVLPYFRAEKPQRGRLREFLQWNCDVIGGEIGDNIREFDVELLGTTVSLLTLFGLSSQAVRVKLGSREAIRISMSHHGVDANLESSVLRLLDERTKTPADDYVARAKALGLSEAFIEEHHPKDRAIVPASITSDGIAELFGIGAEEAAQYHATMLEEGSLTSTVVDHGLAEWCEFDSMIIRGLAYYTGTVFEVIAEGERAVAGGGRYDKLVELMGGPSTPAAGFAMGDVVLSNLLDDKGLMPSEGELPGAVESMLRAQRVRPEVFVVSGAEEDDEHVVPLVAKLRRGIERSGWREEGGKPWQTAQRYSVRPLHARATDKATRNPKKLLQDANRQRARLFCEIHAEGKVELKDLDRSEPVPPPGGHASFSTDPDAPNYVGARAAAHLDR